ncbi:MAG: response regulator transcription factor [Gammaproteobacteria bacterium]|nr:response regulator transcription factor [Gammaproteobacteria bacterium]
MRILVIEDDQDILRQLAERLEHDGHVVDTASTATDGRFIGENHPIDVAVVDLGLPDGSGLDLISAWRRARRQFPVLVLTARGRWQDKVAGLEAGADDYLVKPYNAEELLARLRALARRASGWSSDQLTLGPLEMDIGRKQLSLDGKPVELTSFEYRVLEYLMLNAGRVVSKGEISEHLYPDDDDRDSNVLEVLVARLRRKLDPTRSLNPIETLRGEGYRMRQDMPAPDAAAPPAGPAGRG